MTKNRLFRILIIFLLNVIISSSLFAVKIAIVQYEIQDLNAVGVDAGRLENFIR